MAQSAWETVHGGKPRQFGDELTYKLVAEFLEPCSTVEDWGAGSGWLRQYLGEDVKYKAVDGSESSGADVVADLAEYRAKPRRQGIVLRHVIEHNERWAEILDNAAASFTKRLIVVIHTPAVERTEVVGRDLGLPLIAFSVADILEHLPGATHEEVRTKSRYGAEQVYRVDATAPVEEVVIEPGVDD